MLVSLKTKLSSSLSFEWDLLDRRALVFFFKQKTAYELLRSLVGSEMCIRDRTFAVERASPVTFIDAANSPSAVAVEETSPSPVRLSLIHI